MVCYITFIYIYLINTYIRQLIRPIPMSVVPLGQVNDGFHGLLDSDGWIGGWVFGASKGWSTLCVAYGGVKKNREKKTTNSITDSEFIPHLLMVFKWSFGGE